MKLILVLIILITTILLLCHNLKYFYRELKDFKRWLRERKNNNE